MNVRALRGATTITNNNRENIYCETKSLLEKLIKVNNIVSDDIISIIFSTTKDIDAAYPAAAAREMGLVDIPLMCTNEMEVANSLQKCIRILMHINSTKSNSQLRHMYLKQARKLRPDLALTSIAIDGPAGAGKSTIAKAISEKSGIAYLDTGAMYRTVALKALKENIDSLDAKGLSNIIKDLNMEIRFINNEQHMFLDNEDVSNQIRTPEISTGASNVGLVPAVRIKMAEIQREFALKNDVVMEGRDIGSYVLPDATVKVFLTASIEERAKRRYEQLLLNSNNDEVSIEDIKKDMAYRDKNDSGRQFAPLVKAKDAIEIDTTDLTIHQVVEIIISNINKL